MASAQLIDLDSLSVPLAGEASAGMDLRSDLSAHSNYSRLRDARKAARAEERSNLFEVSNSNADDQWRIVLELAPNILKDEAKDLEVACWYTEALIRRSGFQGLRDGFSLIHCLIKNYWDNLYPLPDEDGMATRVAPLTGLNGEGSEGVLIVPMRNVYLTERVEPGPFNYWQYKQALDAQRLTDEQAREEIIAKNGFKIDDIHLAVENSSQQFYIDLRDDVRAALDEYKSISSLLDEHCGRNDSPPTSNIINTLTDILGAINHLAKHKLPQEVEDVQAQDDDTPTQAGTTATASSSLTIGTREDAFRQLLLISQFFRKTEPHSPISYVIEKAVHWGNLSLAELIQELIPDSGSRSTYGSLTGVKTHDD